MPPLLEQSLAWSAEALRRAERVGDPVLLFWAARHRAGAAARAGDIDEMDRCFDIVGSLAEQLDQPILNWVHSYRRVPCGPRSPGTPTRPNSWPPKHSQIGTDSGQPDATALLRRTARTLVSFNAEPVASWSHSSSRWRPTFPSSPTRSTAALAVAYVEAGRLDDAHRLLEEFAAADFDLPLDPGLAHAHGLLRRRRHRMPGPEVSPAALFDRLAPWADQVPTTGIVADDPVSHYLGGLATVLGRYDEADAYFAHAAEFNDRADAKFFAARTNLSWGKMLAERNAPGDAERARDLLTKAHAAAAAHGYASIERAPPKHSNTSIGTDRCW